MAHPRPTTVDSDDLLTPNGEAHLNDATPDAWGVEEYEPSRQSKSLSATLLRDDGATITIGSLAVAAERLEGHSGQNTVIVHRVEFAGHQTGSIELAGAEDGYDVEQAAHAAIDYAKDNAETALCDAEELRRRFYLLLGDRFGDTIEQQQRNFEQGGHDLGPVGALAETDDLPVESDPDLYDAARRLASNAMTVLNDDPWNYEFLTTDGGTTVGLKDTFKGEVVARTTDATVNQFIDAGLCHENAFTQVVLAQLGEQYGDRFVEKAEELEDKRGWFVIDVARNHGVENNVERNRVGTVVEAVAEEVFSELQGE